MGFFVCAIRSETVAYYVRRSDDHIQRWMRGSHQVSEGAPSIPLVYCKHCIYYCYYYLFYINCYNFNKWRKKCCLVLCQKYKIQLSGISSQEKRND